LLHVLNVQNRRNKGVCESNLLAHGGDSLEVSAGTESSIEIKHSGDIPHVGQPRLLVFAACLGHLRQIKDDIETLLSILTRARAVAVGEDRVCLQKGICWLTPEPRKVNEGKNHAAIFTLVTEPNRNAALVVDHVVDHQNLI